MGNFIADTLAKMATNVTQSVISALIVTAVTTYLIISPGKNEESKDASGKDSAGNGTTVMPVEKSGVTGEGLQSTQQATEKSVPEEIETGRSTNAGAGTSPVAMPATEKKTTPAKTESPVTDAASKAYKELVPEDPAEQKLESTITQGRAKGDSLASAHPQDLKKEEKKEVKDVKKRADEVFDELDQEVQK
jgi:hypothetical protein